MTRRPGKAPAQASSPRTHLQRHLHLTNTIHVRNHVHMQRKEHNRMLDPRRTPQLPLRRELTAVKKVKSLQDPSTSSNSFSPMSAGSSIARYDSTRLIVTYKHGRIINYLVHNPHDNFINPSMQRRVCRYHLVPASLRGPWGWPSVSWPDNNLLWSVSVKKDTYLDKQMSCNETHLGVEALSELIHERGGTNEQTFVGGQHTLELLESFIFEEAWTAVPWESSG